MSIRKIVQVPNEILRRICTPVPMEIDHVALKRIMYDMYHTMVANGGVGLAAPQIGLDFAICIVGEDWPILMINPMISYSSHVYYDADEGCLSIPDVLVNIRRPNSVKIFFEDEFRCPTEVNLYGPKARIAQHEIDHLSGVLITDYGKPKT